MLLDLSNALRRHNRAFIHMTRLGLLLDSLVDGGDGSQGVQPQLQIVLSPHQIVDNADLVAAG